VITRLRRGPTVDITDTTYTRTWTVRDKTAAELAAEKAANTDGALNAPGVKPLISALNKGTFVPGSKYTEAQLKTIIEAEM